VATDQHAAEFRVAAVPATRTYAVQAESDRRQHVNFRMRRDPGVGIAAIACAVLRLEPTLAESC
jgi:hypothetical protein